MSIMNYLWAGALSLLPISELRGGIPYAMAVGAPWWLAFLYCTAVNALAGPIALLFLNSVHALLYRVTAYKAFFDRFVERARAKVKEPVDKYGYWGLMVFVAIPFPLTGAWTGALGGWFLGMDRRKTMLFVALGVLVAGVVVTLVATLGIGALSFFLKKV
jgi:uncharacterized membrane protein